MKRILYLLSCTICITFSWDINADAQNRLFFVPDPTTAHWSYHEMAPDGTLVATMFHSVDTMTGDAVNGSVKLKITRVGIQSPADTLNSFMYYKFKDGECMVDMNAFFEGDALSSLMNAAAENEGREGSEDEKKKAIDEIRKHIEISGEVRGIPRYPVVGDLPDYEFTFKIFFMNMSIKGTQRKICGNEKLVTPAGAFDCFILEETITSKAMLQKDVEKRVSWYAYGIGLVKENTFDKKGNLISTTVLNSINW